MKLRQRVTGILTAIVCGAGAFCGGIQPLIAGADTTGTYGDLTYNTVDSDGDSVDDYVEITDCDMSVTEVEIPAEIDGLPVTIIGDDAFRACDSLASITIPDSVTSIGEMAFAYCNNLSEIVIPRSVESIGKLAFFECDSIKSIIIPESVIQIGICVFQICPNLTEIIVSEDNDYFCSMDGVLFNKNKTELIKYPEGNTNSEYSVPDDVLSIGEQAFEHCDNLKRVTIPESVKNIGWNAFGECDNLERITIKNPECEIDDAPETIYNYQEGMGSFFLGTICGYENSTAQVYAEKYGRNFAVIGTEYQPVQGDISGNGSIDLYDAIEICKSIMGMRTFTDEEKSIADFDGNGVVDLYDAIGIAKELLPK